MSKIIYMGVLISILSFLGCKSEQEKFLDKHDVLNVKTEAFDHFISKAKIKPDKARELMSVYINKNKLENLGGELYFIIDGHYTFTAYRQLKTQTAHTAGIWVNAQNGDVKEVKEGLFLKAHYKY